MNLSYFLREMENDTEHLHEQLKKKAQLCWNIIHGFHIQTSLTVQVTGTLPSTSFFHFHNDVPTPCFV